MVAIVILLVGLLALMRLAVVEIDSNMGNLLRDEAVKIAEEEMTLLRNVDYATLGAIAWTASPGNPLKREFRGVSRDFLVYTKIDDLAAGSGKLVQVAVGWNYKGSGTSRVPTNSQYQHIVTSIISRPPAL